MKALSVLAAITMSVVFADCNRCRAGRVLGLPKGRVMAAYPSRQLHRQPLLLARGLLSRIVVVAPLVTGAVLWAAPASLACSGGPSAVNVYTECLPTGGGGSKPTSTGQATGTGTSQSVVTPALSTRTAKALKHAGKDSGILSALVHSHLPTLARQSNSQSATAPSTLSSAFNLGSGPTALLIVLAGTPLLLLGGSGFRKWRHHQ
jgi:hypothetical protein